MDTTQDDLVTFLDLLNIDESIVDQHFQDIMKRSNHSKKQLLSSIHFLRYKHLINKLEGIECENEEEFNFVVQILPQLNLDNVEYVCEIVNLVLGLNPSNVSSKSEHLLQQLLPEIESLTKGDADIENCVSPLLLLKICDSILSTISIIGHTVSLLFFDIHLERNILNSPSEVLKNHYLMSTVPHFVNTVKKYDVLNNIWVYIKSLTGENKSNALKILSSLSEYYLPVVESDGIKKYNSNIMCQPEFWEIVLYGLNSDDSGLRKISIYLSKRSIDCLLGEKLLVNVKNDDDTAMFFWDPKDKENFYSSWQNYFLLIESLEEKQSNIVLPSLQLFEKIDKVGPHWITCALNIGLKHDNTQVKIKCIENRIKFTVQSHEEAQSLLGALNDLNLYEDSRVGESILTLALQKSVILLILQVFPMIKWSPVPLYYVSKVLAQATIKDTKQKEHQITYTQLFCDILRIPCNNVVIRDAVHSNIVILFCSCLEINTTQFFKVLCSVENFDELLLEYPDMSIKVQHWMENKTQQDREGFYDVITSSHCYVQFALLYLRKHQPDLEMYMKYVEEKIMILNQTIKRQYCIKNEHYMDFAYLVTWLQNTQNKTNAVDKGIFFKVSKEVKSLLLYVSSLLTSETPISTVVMDVILFKCNCWYTIDHSTYSTALQVYRESLVILRASSTHLDKKVLSMNIVKKLTSIHDFIKQIKEDIINVNDVISIGTINIRNDKKVQNSRLMNQLYKDACATLLILCHHNIDSIEIHSKEILNFMDDVQERGGYGCIKILINIMESILLCIKKAEQYDLISFISKMWKEIQETKTNQYEVGAFASLLSHYRLLTAPEFYETVIEFWKQIIQNYPGLAKPLFKTTKLINSRQAFSKTGDYLLFEILMFVQIPRKDQRIQETIEIQINENINRDLASQSTLIPQTATDTNMHLAVASLLAHNCVETFTELLQRIRNKIDETFKNKQRYHGNSYHHRLLLTGLQHILFISLLQPGASTVNEAMTWSVKMLGRLPHQPSVKLCLEWFIAYSFCTQNLKVNDASLQTLEFSSIPEISQFMILFHILKHKIVDKSYTNEEYEYVMDYLLSHCMGQMFNIRLHAQYLSVKLYNQAQNESSKYDYTIALIKKTFAQSAKEKSYIKMQEDYLINHFDIISCLTPSFIYLFLPRYFDVAHVNRKKLDLIYLPSTLECQHYLENVCTESKLDTYNVTHLMLDSEVYELIEKIQVNSENIKEDLEITGTIQKKFIPWRNMSDINVYDSKKKLSSSELIVVASLIDKLPNLGGMARSSEVFGVKTYVIDSLRHLQDKNFQGLSVSAERWVDIQEVRPGKLLKEYLMARKAEGYSIVAAEQTSSSVPLPTFKFQKKTLLLLGHEKEGVPCDLLPLMDHCVEIPQQGFVRSLNVHVTAAIFVWEYSRQIML